MFELERDDLVLVTGSDGFIGSAVTLALIERGCAVRAMVEPGSEARNLDGLDVERHPADVRDPTAVRKATEGCRAVFHLAALYRFSSRQPADFYDVNVRGTLNVLEAARDSGCERVVYTSSVGTLGVEAAGLGCPSDESSFPDLAHLFGPYKRSKYVAEHEVLRAAAEGLPATIVLPTFPLGPRDRHPTPTGRLVLDFLNGRLPGYVDTVLNVVHVDDVAQGHLLALSRGSVGRSYILGGENLTLRQLLSELARRTGLPLPAIRLPGNLAVGVAWLSEVVEGRILGREPSVPLEAARMSRTKMAFDDTRARSELGYSSRPAVEAIADSARWFLDNGYVNERRRARIRWQA